MLRLIAASAIADSNGGIDEFGPNYRGKLSTLASVNCHNREAGSCGADIARRTFQAGFRESDERCSIEPTRRWCLALKFGYETLSTAPMFVHFVSKPYAFIAPITVRSIACLPRHKVSAMRELHGPVHMQLGSLPRSLDD